MLFEPETLPYLEKTPDLVATLLAARSLVPDEAKEMADEADFDGPLMDWKTKGHTVELAGKEPVEGADALKLKLTRQPVEVDGWFETRYLDNALRTQSLEHYWTRYDAQGKPLG